MEFDGVWKGEYVMQWFSYRTGREVAVPFVIRIETKFRDEQNGFATGLFEGICQDDPEISGIRHHATIMGSYRHSNVFFIKQYPKLLVRGTNNEIVEHEGSHPEIIYKGEFTKNEISGVWNLNRTFRKVNGKFV
jgi:hypothetical protein